MGKPSKAQRTKEPIEQFNRFLVRKIIKEVRYCDGRKKTLFAFTFELNSLPNRESFLREKIDNFADFECSEAKRVFGYSDNQEFDEADTIGFEYPEFDVGFES